MSLKKANVIVITDNLKLRREIKSVLSEESEWELTVSQTGSSGIKKIEKTDFDLIIFDVDSKDTENFKTHRKIIKMELKIPIIFLMSHVEKSNKSNLFSEIFDFIYKPVRPGILKIKLRSVLEIIKIRSEFENVNTHIRCMKKVIEERSKQIEVYDERMEKLCRFFRALNTSNFDVVIDNISGELPKIFPIDYFSLFLYNEKTHLLEMLLHNHTGLEGRIIIKPFEEYGIMSEVINTRQKVFVTQFSRSKFSRAPYRKKYKDGYAASFPLFFDHTLIAILNFSGNSRGFFDNMDFASVALACETIAGALSNTFRNQSIRYIAQKKDPDVIFQ